MGIQNIEMTVDEKKKKLTLVVDLTKSIGLSKSEKNMNIATTGGNTEVPGFPGVKFGLNVYGPKEGIKK